ncbi:MAG TPA: SUMF1/EgtB/PvdO family nonheme iron enzyme [Gemmataceae bacterium]|nr:SUMF1/EgtB/PvdO family nonheme iron enzyme [Gemmataceae bacterium]
MLTDESFLRAILADPVDDAPWLIYADWLEERGDPLAILYRNRRVTNSLGMKLMLIPPGQFLMGAPETEDESEDDERPLHEVEITRPFYLGAFPVTQDEYERVMGDNPSHFKSIKGQDTRRFPVEYVYWDDAVEFCRKLSEWPEEKSAGRLYRLPTEAEWEYSCRGGASDSKPFYLKKAATSLSSVHANFNGRDPYGGASRGQRLNRPTPVGSYMPNTFGLYDMHGNVLEWCADWFDEDYYSQSPRQDPQGPDASPDNCRVARGGSWFFGARSCRAATRDKFEFDSTNRALGFRVVCCLGARTA